MERFTSHFMYLTTYEVLLLTQSLLSVTQFYIFLSLSLLLTHALSLSLSLSYFDVQIV